MFAVVPVAAAGLAVFVAQELIDSTDNRRGRRRRKQRKKGKAQDLEEVNAAYDDLYSIYQDQQEAISVLETALEATNSENEMLKQANNLLQEELVTERTRSAHKLAALESQLTAFKSRSPPDIATSFPSPACVQANLDTAALLLAGGTASSPLQPHTGLDARPSPGNAVNPEPPTPPVEHSAQDNATSSDMVCPPTVSVAGLPNSAPPPPPNTSDPIKSLISEFEKMADPSRNMDTVADGVQQSELSEAELAFLEQMSAGRVVTIKRTWSNDMGVGEEPTVPAQVPHRIQPATECITCADTTQAKTSPEGAQGKVTGSSERSVSQTMYDLDALIKAVSQTWSPERDNVGNNLESVPDFVRKAIYSSNKLPQEEPLTEEEARRASLGSELSLRPVEVSADSFGSRIDMESLTCSRSNSGNENMADFRFPVPGGSLQGWQKLNEGVQQGPPPEPPPPLAVQSSEIDVNIEQDLTLDSPLASYRQAARESAQNGGLDLSWAFEEWPELRDIVSRSATL